MLLRLALRSLASRHLTVGLTVTSVALSVALLLAVDTIRTGAKESFANTISDTDLIMGARSGGVQLLLYSVFQVGNATNNVTWDSYREIEAMDGVAWMVPISLGDSHRGYRVMGTSTAFFDHYKYRGGRDIAFADGHRFDDLFDAVVGADVAETLGYGIGQEIVVAHGIVSFSDHADKPFQISGILEPTGTPVDRTVYVSLEAIEAIHVDWQGDGRSGVSAEEVRGMDLTPGAVTAALIGVEDRLRIFALQRAINEYREEPLLAILPGVALSELWSLVGVAEAALLAVSAMVVVTALLGLAAMILAGLEARRREMAILRAVGARPRTILALLMLEAVTIAAFGALLGVLLLYVGLLITRGWIDSATGIYLELSPPGAREGLILAAVIGAGAAASLVPALRAYALSLADGMTLRT
ncbi:MAG: ABC transporter permease [Pseudomonadota bacterium]